MYALVDCNNFFVSCERVFRPQLEGRAVVVLSNNDGCVVARSNESKALGIQMSTPFYKIRHLVDSGLLEVCSSNYALYGDMSSRVMSIIASSAPKIEVYSVDEAFMVMDGFEQERILKICRETVAKILRWVGIPVSIGIAPTKTLAKVASRFAKRYPGYRGVCMISNDEKRVKALELTAIEDVWGIGRKLSARLRESGVRTALDFERKSGDWVRRNYHVMGLKTWNELHGVPSVAEELSDKRKSICTSRSFDKMLSDENEIAVRVAEFASLCAKKLRGEHTAAKTVTVFLLTNRFREDLPQDYPAAVLHLPVAANNTTEIVVSALKAFRMIWKDGYLYKKAGVIVGEITDECATQPVLFGFDAEMRRKLDAVSHVMDRFNGPASDVLRVASSENTLWEDGIRSDYRSRQYSTKLNEVIEVSAK